MSRFVAFIPIRSGSKSIPGKNVKIIAGKPLVMWSAEAAADCPLIDRVYIASDSVGDMMAVYPHVQTGKIVLINRHPETATGEAQIESAMLEFANEYNFDHIVMMQATSPCVTSHDLARGIRKYLAWGYDSLLSVTRQKRFVWQESGVPLNYDPQDRPRRQDWDGFLVENGAFFITSKKALLDSQCRVSGKIGLYEMPEHTYWEIDEPLDWAIFETLLKQKRGDK